jgi:hypothetical protein
MECRASGIRGHKKRSVYTFYEVVVAWLGQWEGEGERMAGSK